MTTPQGAQAAIVFEDGLGTLGPLTDLRPAALVRTGALTTLDRLRAHPSLSVRALWVDSAWEQLADEMTDVPVGEKLCAEACAEAAGGAVLLVNGRSPLVSAETLGLAAGEALVEVGSGHVVAARVAAKDAAAVLRTIAKGGGLGDAFRVKQTSGAALLSKPWHVRTFRDACLAADLASLDDAICGAGAHRSPQHVTQLGDQRVVVHHTARVGALVVLDAEHGRIVIDRGATIRPGAILIGPCYVGEDSTVLERATIRPGTSIGPWCKVNGEVGGTIFQGFANKAHDGYLGDSFVGEWVNLGAGTTNSNLLNTYGETIARALHDAKHERTGEQFLGAIMGDHIKTAICTRIMTASVLGTGCMFASTAPVAGTVKPFSWVTDAGTHPYRLEKFEEVMLAAMARRKVTPSAAYLSRVRALCAGA